MCGAVRGRDRIEVLECKFPKGKEYKHVCGKNSVGCPVPVFHSQGTGWFPVASPPMKLKCLIVFVCLEPTVACISIGAPPPPPHQAGHALTMHTNSTRRANWTNPVATTPPKACVLVLSRGFLVQGNYCSWGLWMVYYGVLRRTSGIPRRTRAYCGILVAFQGVLGRIAAYSWRFKAY